MSFFNQKEVRELRETIDMVISIDNSSSCMRKDFVSYIIPPLYKKVEKNITRSDDGRINIIPSEHDNPSQEILDFCFDNKCSVREVYRALSIHYLCFNPLMQKLTYEIVKNTKNPTLGDLFKALMPNGISFTFPQYSMETLKQEIKGYLNITTKEPQAYQEMLDNSYEEIKKIISKSIKEIDTVVPIKIELDEIKDEVEHQQEILNDVFTNKSIMANIKRDNHFLNPLLNDAPTITEDNKVVFGNFTNSLSIGFTDKAIKIGMEKTKVLNQFKTLLNSYTEINKIEKEDHTAKIHLIQECINFIENTNSKYIPFKELSKKLNMTKNQVRNFCKYLFNVESIRLPKNFNDYKSFPNTIK